MFFSKAFIYISVLVTTVTAIACGSIVASSLHQDVKPISNAKDILSWHFRLPKRFQDGDIDAITGAWAPSYISSIIDTDGTRTDEARKAAFDMFTSQINYNGRFASENGPQEVLVGSITEKDGVITVNGIWSGSWRLGRADALQESGMSFENKFKATWKPVGKTKTWKLVSLVNFIKRIEDKEYEKTKAADAELRKKYNLQFKLL